MNGVKDLDLVAADAIGELIETRAQFTPKGDAPGDRHRLAFYRA
jgi:hypothetical protein